MLEPVGIPAHILQRFFRLPAQKLFGFGRIGVVYRDIAGTARGDHIRYRDFVYAGKGTDHVQYGIPVAGAEVDDLGAGMPGCVVAGLDMTACQVDNMDVIADTGPVRCGIWTSCGWNILLY